MAQWLAKVQVLCETGPSNTHMKHHIQESRKKIRTGKKENNKQHNLQDEATGERCFYGIFTIKLIFKEKMIKKAKFIWTIHFPALVAQRGPIFNLRSGRHSSPR